MLLFIIIWRWFYIEIKFIIFFSIYIKLVDLFLVMNMVLK